MYVCPSSRIEKRFCFLAPRDSWFCSVLIVCGVGCLRPLVTTFHGGVEHVVSVERDEVQTVPLLPRKDMFLVSLLSMAILYGPLSDIAVGECVPMVSWSSFHRSAGEREQTVE